MNSTPFARELEARSGALRVWGDFVVSTISEKVRQELDDVQYETFFKITPLSRVKAIASASSKQEKKAYVDPLHEMVDQVGARFVVLLPSDLSVVERAIGACSSWTKQRDRSPLQEIRDWPKVFDYQSIHYVLRNASDMVIAGINVPALMPCEVQLRTLLQHAYAEFVHDRIYKQGAAVIPADVLRSVAKGQALLETTDALLNGAAEELDRVNQGLAQWCAFLDTHATSVGLSYAPTAHDNVAYGIIETYHGLLLSVDPTLAVADAMRFKDKIVRRAPERPLFARPVTFALYWLVKNHNDEVSTRWPADALVADLELIKSDLGIS